MLLGLHEAVEQHGPGVVRRDLLLTTVTCAVEDTVRGGLLVSAVFCAGHFTGEGGDGWVDEFEESELSGALGLGCSTAMFMADGLTGHGWGVAGAPGCRVG